MKQIIIKDYETSDSRVNFGQVIQAGIVITDDKLNIKNKLELRCRLKPNVIPSIGASLVHGTSVDQLKNHNKSHYEMVLEHYKFIKANLNSLFLNKLKNSSSTNNSSLFINPFQSLLSALGFPPK